MRGSARKASTSSSDRSCGWLVVKRTRSMPGTWATRSSSSAKEMPPRYEFTFWPISVTSRTPTVASDATSCEHLGEGPAHLAAAGVRDHAEAADVVAALHHGDELAHLARASCPGRPAGRRTPRSPPRRSPTTRARSSSTRSRISGSLPMASGPKTKSRYGTRASSFSFSCCATQPPTPSSAPALQLHRPVAPERGEHLVLGLLADGAGVEDDEVGVLGHGRRPVADVASDSPMRSESLTFIWQPKVWTK